MSTRHRIIVRAGKGVAAAAAAAAVLGLAGCSSANTSTNSPIHLFSKSVSNGAFQANGQPIADQNAQPAVGDYFTSTGLDYSGNHTSHDANYEGSDHLVCTVTESTSTSVTGICDAEIAINGSLLYADHQTLDLTNNITNVHITGGSGVFNGVTGTVASTSIANSNNSDFTITYSH